MQPLLIGPGELAELARVKAYAEAHFFTLEAVRAAMESGESHCMADGFRCVLPFGFRVAFTVEEHPAGWCRHVSVSLSGSPIRLPSPEAMTMIGRALGMRLDLTDPSTASYTEGEPPFAISIIEPVRPGRSVDLMITDATIKRLTIRKPGS